MNPIFVKLFNKGLITRIEDKDISRGSASDMLNWHILGDHIELRRGQVLLGTEIATAGRVSGLLVARKYDDSQIPFFTEGRKLFYYNAATDANVEVSTDLLPSGVITADDPDGEDVALAQYDSPAGNMIYASSPNSSIYKIPVANPGSAVDLLSRTYRGKMKIKQSRMFLWDRTDDFGGSDKTGLYLSYVDQTEDAYSFTSKESLGTGNGALTTFTGTLAFKASNSKETAFYLVVAGPKTASKTVTNITKATAAVVTAATHGFSVGDTVTFAAVIGMTEINDRIGVITAVADANTFTVNIDSTGFTAYSSAGTAAKCERFTDNRSGVLVGSDGGTGTINYATGAYSVTFAAPVTNLLKVVAQYFREDATVHGIADFSFSSTRTAGQGNVFRQDDRGGKLMDVFSFSDVEYCMHEFKTWVLTLPVDDTTAENKLYRDNVGVPSFRGGVATGDGIHYVDALGESPSCSILEYGRFLNQVVPRSISDQLILDGYEFDRAVRYEWGDYIALACRTSDSTVNNRLFMYHTVWKSWEVHSFRISCLDTLNGGLLGGDAGSPNIFKLFSGLADEAAMIENFYITNNDPLNKEGVKQANIMKVAGMIGDDQQIDVSYSLDYAPFVFAKSIFGDGSYVDTSSRKLIGNMTLGAEQIGGGEAEEGAIFASPYEIQFFVGTDRFERIRLKFEAKKVGYAGVSEYGFVDMRDKGRSLPEKYVD